MQPDVLSITSELFSGYQELRAPNIHSLMSNFPPFSKLALFREEEHAGTCRPRLTERNEENALLFPALLLLANKDAR